GTIRIIERDEALETFPPLWEALARMRPGVFIRSRDWWELRAVHDPPERRGGAGPERYALLQRGGGAGAVAIYRHKVGWPGGRAARSRSSRLSQATPPHSLTSGATCWTSTGSQRSRRGWCRRTIRCSSCSRRRGACAIAWATACG